MSNLWSSYIGELDKILSSEAFANHLAIITIIFGGLALVGAFIFLVVETSEIINGRD